MILSFENAYCLYIQFTYKQGIAVNAGTPTSKISGPKLNSYFKLPIGRYTEGQNSKKLELCLRQKVLKLSTKVKVPDNEMLIHDNGNITTDSGMILFLYLWL